MAIPPPPYTIRKSPTIPADPALSRHRTLSTRSKQPPARSSPSPAPPLRRKVSLFASLRASTRPDLSRRLFRLIKSENHVITAYNTAAHERQCIATQLSEWGESTGDDAVSELSDKLGVILAEIGGLEEGFATNLEGCRTVLKTIRNTESSVGPSRENRARILEDIRRLEYKEPNSPRLAILEQELVRAEAENLVAEAQLTNITRAKLKEAYVKHFAAVVERAEKQAILARHGRRMLELLNDEPVVPGDMHEPFEREGEARQILNDAEEELRQWTSDIEESSLAQQVTTTAPSSALIPQATPQVTEVHPAHREVHPALRNGSSTVESFAPSTYGSAYNEPPYPISEEERAARTMIAA